MKLELDQATFSALVGRTQGIVDRRSTVPMLANVLIDAGEKDALNISATDYELYLRASCEARVDRKGRVAINARDLNEIVKNMPSGPLTIEQEKPGQVTIRSGNIKFNLHCAPAEEFPELPEIKEVQYFDIKPKDFLDIVSHTIFAVASDDPRIFLNGAYVEMQKAGKIRMVGTDGHRLALIDRELENAPELENSVIIPRKGLMEMTKLLSEGVGAEEKIELGFTKTNAHLRRANISLMIRLIEGEFPDYNMVIPRAAEKIATVPRRAFIDALKRMSLLSVERTFGVKMRFAEGSMKIESSHPDKGESMEVLDIDYDKTELSVGFNARFFLDVLTVLDCDDVKLELSDELSPCVLRPALSEDYRCIIMPVRVS